MTSVHDSDNDAIFGKNLSVYGKKAAGSRPLWEVMEESTGTVAEWGDMIRAVADWIENRQVTPPNVREVIGWLRAEADRAERGETVNSSENV